MPAEQIAQELSAKAQHYLFAHPVYTLAATAFVLVALGLGVLDEILISIELLRVILRHAKHKLGQIRNASKGLKDDLLS